MISFKITDSSNVVGDANEVALGSKTLGGLWGPKRNFLITQGYLNVGINYEIRNLLAEQYSILKPL
jgi:hypothetical protein